MLVECEDNVMLSANISRNVAVNVNDREGNYLGHAERQEPRVFSLNTQMN